MPRLFVALRPPEPVRDALVDAMEALEGARWQDDEQLHLTLRFIGEVDRRQAEDVATALSRVTFEAFAVELRGVGHFERKGAPRAIWARVTPSLALSELQSRIEGACRSAGCEPEGRAFLPHVTIARLGRASAPIGDWLARHGALRADWVANDFRLYESRLTRNGSHYEEMARFGR